jgi:hypothetical protein
MTARRCTACGQEMGSRSRYVTQCGACNKKRMQAAREDTYVYQNVHVHVAADGTKTIKTGTECGEMCA